MDLNLIAEDIRNILIEKRKSIQLTFEEDKHIYEMLDKNMVLRNDYPSVSKVVEFFHDKFDTEGKSFKKAKGNLKIQEQLKLEWKEGADYASNTGSRVHYILEKNLIEQYGNYKDVRQPIFECNDVQIEVGDRMVSAGNDFIKMMHSKGAVLLDTEIVLGSPLLWYTGQPDTMWLFKDKNGEIGIIITDWKTNKPKNFEVHFYTNKMYEPFGWLDNNALGHYNIQLPLYAKLLYDMLKGTKYEKLKFFGAIIVLLKDDSTYEEHRISKNVYNKIFEMDILDYINTKKLEKEKGSN